MDQRWNQQYVLAQESATNPSFLLFETSQQGKTGCTEQRSGKTNNDNDNDNALHIWCLQITPSGIITVPMGTIRIVDITDQVETDDRLASEC